MADPNIDKALAYLGSTISSLVDSSREPIDYKSIPSKIPKRSLSGDHVHGGKISNFSSLGITDEATETKITVKNDSVIIDKLFLNEIVNSLKIHGDLHSQSINSPSIKADVIEAKKIIGDFEQGKNESVKFIGDNIYGQGLIWSAPGSTSQIVLRKDPTRFFVSEDVELAKDKTIMANGAVILSDKQLGNSVTKSNIRELGRLKGLVVDGDINVGQYIFYSNSTNRLGLGTESPNSALSISENDIEVGVGTKDNNKGYIGTFASHQFDIVTDNLSRVTIHANGNIDLGNRNNMPIAVSVNGRLGINSNSIDERVNLQVNGAIKFNNNLHLSMESPPSDGNFTQGDVVWNSQPKIGSYIGWVCTKAGNPGVWAAFGSIKPS